MEFIQQNWYWAALAAVSGGMLIFTSVKGGAKGISPQEATQLINREDALVMRRARGDTYGENDRKTGKELP